MYWTAKKLAVIHQTIDVKGLIKDYVFYDDVLIKFNLVLIFIATLSNPSV